MAKILLVEDNEMNRDMLQRRLERRGYEVRIAANATEGLEIAGSAWPDLILMDISLPDIDGWQATSQLKADPETRRIPVLALTAHALNSDRERSFQAGCDDYDTKPVDFDRLLRKIQQLLTLARSAP